jgi:hypothetical protein
MEPEHIAVYRTLAEEGALPVRVLVASEVLGAALQVGSADAATLRDSSPGPGRSRELR